MAEQPTTKRRRVPAEQRKRGEQSCDLCKKRRCKCVCSPGSETCQTCQRIGLECTRTAPTKTRFHGSVEDLSDRYRCLEAIVKSAFPDEPTTTAVDLLRLGERKGYEMPDLSAGVPKRLEELVRVQENASPSSLGNELEQSIRAQSQEAEVDSDVVPQTTSSSAPTLVRDPAGRVHYIGPSGSLTFFAEIRELVSSYQQDQYPSDNSRSNFTGDNIAEALETEGQEGDGIVPEAEVGSSGEAVSMTSPLSTASNNTNHRDLDEQLKLLPPREIMEVLIASYFDHCHDDLPLFHRATFQDEYEAFILLVTTRDRQHIPPPEHGWLACLHMILVFGSLSAPKSQNLSKIDCNHVQRLSIAATHSLLLVLATKCVLSNIQALVLFCLYLHNNKDRNAAWNLIGTATRMGFALGLHNDLDSRFRPVERETRKRVWCTLFTFDQFLCSSLGRPSGSTDPDVEVRVPIEGLLDGGTGAGDHFVENNLKLQHILVSARRLVGLRHKSETSTSSRRDLKRRHGSVSSIEPPNKATLTIHGILEELNLWRKNLPLHLQLQEITSSTHARRSTSDGLSFDQLRLSLSRQNPRQLRALILLHIQYHHIVMLVTRPMLLAEIASSRSAADGNNENTNQLPDEQTFDSPRSLTSTSVSSAAQISLLTLLLDEFSLLNGTSGLDIFYAYSSAMVLLLRILWIQQSTELKYIDEEIRRKRALKDLVTGLRTVVANTRKSKTMERFAGVMNKFGDMIDNINSSRTTTSGEIQMRSSPQDNRSGKAANPVRKSSSDTRDALELPTRYRNAATLPPAGHTYEQSHQQQLHSSTNHITAISAPTPGSNNYLSPGPQNMYPSPISGPPTVQPNYPFWPQINPSGQPMSYTSSLQGSAEGQMPWYSDPLDALANGQVFEWNELDAFIGGQFE